MALPLVWGATDAEVRRRYPADELLDGDVLRMTRAVGVDAAPEVTWRWLCQVAVAPYSYDWIDNRGRRSPQALIDGLDALEVGQRACTIFEVVGFEPGRSLTLDSTTPWFGRTVITYQADPVTAGACRLVAKLVYRMPRNVYGWVARHVLPLGDFVMMRRQLLNFRGLAERDARALSPPTRA